MLFSDFVLPVSTAAIFALSFPVTAASAGPSQGSSDRWGTSQDVAAFEQALDSGRWLLGSVSTHTDDNYDYESFHRMIGYQHGGWTGAYFTNSYNEDSFLVGYHFTYEFIKDWEAGLLVGASYGYRDCLKGWDRPDQTRKVCGALVPTVRYLGFSWEPMVMIQGSAIAAGASITNRNVVRAFKALF